jgi:hypothetical protein
MATQPPRSQTREEQRRLSIRTLIIASVASAAAAVVTSQFWVHGTWIAAAMTPVIVSLVSEMLHRPTEAVARRITTDRPAVLPPREPRREGERGAELAPGQITVYGGRERSRPGGPSGRKKLAVGVVAATGVLGFAIAAVALTVPELITGQPIGNGNGGTTIFGGGKKTSDKQQTTPTQTQQQQTQTQKTTPTQTQPQQTQTQQTTPQQGKQQTAPAPPPAGQQQQR